MKKISASMVEPPSDITVTITLTGSFRDFSSLIEDLGNCYSDGYELKSEIMRVTGIDD